GYLALVRTLGRRTAELHLALAAPTDNPDFAPEPVSRHDLSVWGRSIAQDAKRTLELLATRRDLLGAADVAKADSLIDARHVLQEQLDRLIPEHPSGVKTRYHGDYHLGQVLLTHNDFTIIDFEGEPARPLDERRRKHSPLRDVAGMLRSFSYAAATAVARQTENRTEQHEFLEHEARDWETEVRRAFVASYAETARAGGLFPDWTPAENLIDLFMIEKALYEVRYELANRPNWVSIPLRGLLALVPAGG
ncbi:MAG TPA: alpha-amylase, partial [Gammaproteobacteria bacterium]|nr:alpha-amylase [Gammaproteobacteria bacterium]